LNSGSEIPAYVDSEQLMVESSFEMTINTGRYDRSSMQCSLLASTQ